MAQDKPQLDKKHPDEWERDLNPDRLAGQNIGEQSAGADPAFVSAADVKDLVKRLQDFDADELREIPVLRAGTRLLQGATYVDLRDPGRNVFTATGEMTATASNCFVPKSETPYQYWNRLIGSKNVQRTQ
jgi:hypothetical protein